MSRYDIAIIGTGPAGLSAAITATIRNKKVLLLGSRELSPKLEKAHEIHNYLGFPADKLVDDGGTMFYPMQITFNGKEIPLTHTIMNDSCLHVSGVYEDENGAQFTFYTTSAVSKKTVERGIEKGDYTEKAYGTYLAGEKRSYGTLYAQVWMGEYGFKYVCSYKNADESDANYETASALIQALMASGEYHELPAE